MATEDFVVEDGGDGETVEAVRERFPQFDRETALAFVVETIDSGRERGGEGEEGRERRGGRAGRG